MKQKPYKYNVKNFQLKLKTTPNNSCWHKIRHSVYNKKMDDDSNAH